ncbi:MAG: NAD(P)/FAD-dependent oxidoreductase [Runella sp.]
MIGIVGAGHAGIQAAISLRELGYEGQIKVFSEESFLPYQRPPLSKGFLGGKQTIENLWFRNESFYQNHFIDIVLDEKIIEINTTSKTIKSQKERSYSYDKLILALGARPRILKGIPHQVFYLQTLKDAQNLQNALQSCDNMMVIGGGFIGLEVAASAIEKGKKVQVFEAQSRLMARVVPPILSEVFFQKHQEMGVEIHLNATTTFENFDHPLKTIVVAGIGVEPNQELAQQAGLLCDNGIVVDSFLQTSNEDIYAIGDCANHFNPFFDKRCRIESVQNATDQAKVVAQHIAGKATAYHEVPWFWTHQYDLKLQMAGNNSDYDQMIFRGNPQSTKFSIFYLKKGHLVGVDSLNRPADHIAARKLIQAGITPTMEQIENIDFKFSII